MGQTKTLDPTATLRSQIICPHCWHSFSPEDILWIAVHPDLHSDPRLPDEPQRFLPTRFNETGDALDLRGMPCRRLACPRCHLEIPRAFLELAPFFVSIFGAPSSGKSYFLAAMTWRLRKAMRDTFGLDFADADPQFNGVLTRYEELLFLNPKANSYAELPKTDQQGQTYQKVLFGKHEWYYPKPFTFTVRPIAARKTVTGATSQPWALCLYDNAGEHFLPGAETTKSPGTQHFAYSKTLLFLFDPTQHPRFREHCRGKTADLQMSDDSSSAQHLVLLEAASRVRSQLKLRADQLHHAPLVVVVTKFDTWSSLTNTSYLGLSKALRNVGSPFFALNLDSLQGISQIVRFLLQQHAPEVVSAAEAFCREVIYIPVSALGIDHKRKIDKETRRTFVQPASIEPMWAEVPMYYAMYRAAPGLIPAAKSKPQLAAGPHKQKQAKFKGAS